MLSRGAICRLAADVPKTSTHDLPRLSHVLQSRLLSRNALSLSLSLPAARALSRAYKAALSEYRRSYATAAAATKPTTRVKKDVKKAVAKKPVKKPAAKKNPPKKAIRKPAKKAATKKAAPKKKKAAAKPKPKRRAATPEEKLAANIKELKATALLKAPLSGSHMHAWHMFFQESMAGVTDPTARTTIIKDASVKYKNLTPAEQEHYNHLANERSAKLRAEYDAWIRTHTPEQIRLANNARNLLKRRIAAAKAAGNKVSIASSRLQPLKDDRQVKRPITGYARFVVQRIGSGDFKNIDTNERMKLVAEEWKALSAGEKEKFNAEFRTEMAAHKSNQQSA